MLQRYFLATNGHMVLVVDSELIAAEFSGKSRVCGNQVGKISWYLVCVRNAKEMCLVLSGVFNHQVIRLLVGEEMGR